MGQGIIKLVKNRSYVCYWLATAFSMGASNILQFMLALYVLDKTGSSTIFASVLSIIVVPRIILTPISGVIGDRVKKLYIIKSLNIFTFLLMLFYAFIIHIYKDFSLNMVYALVIFLEIIEVFYQTPESAILPEIIGKDLLNEAASLAKIDDGIVYITAPLIGAFLYNNFAMSYVFIAIAFLIFLTTILNFFIKTPYETKIDEKKTNSIKSYWKDFIDGIREMNSDRLIKNLAIVVPFLNFSFAAVFTVVISYLFIELYGISNYTFGLYRSITSSMVLIVPILILPVVKKFKIEKLLSYVSLIISSCIFLIAILSYIGLAGDEKAKLVTVFIIAFFDCITIASVMPLNIATFVFFQEHIKDEYRSRILSVFKMFAMTSVPLGNMFYGFLSDRLPIYFVIGLAGFLVFIIYPCIRKLFSDLEEV